MQGDAHILYKMSPGMAVCTCTPRTKEAGRKGSSWDTRWYPASKQFLKTEKKANKLSFFKTLHKTFKGGMIFSP